MKSDISHYKIVPESDIITGYWFLSYKFCDAFMIYKIVLHANVDFSIVSY